MCSLKVMGATSYLLSRSLMIPLAERPDIVDFPGFNGHLGGDR